MVERNHYLFGVKMLYIRAEGKDYQWNVGNPFPVSNETFTKVESICADGHELEALRKVWNNFSSEKMFTEKRVQEWYDQNACLMAMLMIHSLEAQ